MAWKNMNSGEEEKALAYIKDEPEVNLFISGDIRNFGIDGKHVRIRAYEKEGALAGLLLRYMSRNYVFFTKEVEFPFAEAASFIRKDNPSLKGVALSGKKELIEKIAPFLSPLKIEDMMMARCDKIQKLPDFPQDVSIRPLTSVQDFELASDLTDSIEEFASFKKDKKETIDGFLAGKERGSLAIGVFQKEVLVAMASTSADTEESAMLVGVCTRVGYRQKGYASLAVGTLLNDRFRKGEKFVCLFYDNPLAGRIYHAFGFVDVAPYSVLH